MGPLTTSHYISHTHTHIYIYIGMTMGRGRKMGSSSPSRMVLSCPIPILPSPTLSRMTGKTFLPYPRPLGPCEPSPHPTKLYFLLICSTTSTIFLLKLISLIKIYLKLQLNLSYQIKSIFRKNWIIYPSVNNTIKKKKKS